MKQQLRLFIRLMKEPRIPSLLKLLPIIALIYLIAFPDLFPGPVDDAGIMALLLGIFYASVPGEIIEEHKLVLK